MPSDIEVYQLCTTDDDYVRERVRWVVTLDSGLTVYQDDDRPGVEPHSAWTRLKSYCEEQGRSITGFALQFRTHKIDLPSGADGYYFAKTADMIIGASQTFHGVRAGYVAASTVYTTKYAVPELVPSSERQITTIDVTNPSLIVKPEILGGL